jgi:hypothetical protein
MSGSVICPDCKGNGYIGSSKEKILKQIVILVKVRVVLI